MCRTSTASRPTVRPRYLELLQPFHVGFLGCSVILGYAVVARPKLGEDCNILGWPVCGDLQAHSCIA